MPIPLKDEHFSRTWEGRIALAAACRFLVPRGVDAEAAIERIYEMRLPGWVERAGVDPWTRREREAASITRERDLEVWLAAHHLPRLPARLAQPPPPAARPPTPNTLTAASEAPDLSRGLDLHMRPRVLLQPRPSGETQDFTRRASLVAGALAPASYAWAIEEQRRAYRETGDPAVLPAVPTAPPSAR